MAWRDPFDVQLGGPVLQATDLAPAEKDSQATGFLDNLTATRREMELVGNTNATGERMRSAYAPLVSALEGAGESFGQASILGRSVRAHFLNPFDLNDDGGIGVPTRSAMRAEIFARIRARRAIDKTFLAGVPDTPDAFEDQSRQSAAAELQKIRRVQANATGLGQLGGFVGGVAGSFEDPVNLWTMPFGGASKTIMGAAARAALENMLVEAVSEPKVMQNYAELGETMSFDDAARNVLFAGGAGGLFGGGTKAIGKGFAAAGPAYDRFIAGVHERLPEAVREKWTSGATIDDRTLAETIRATVPEERWTPEQRDAVNVAERDAEIREASPFVASPDGDEAHAQGLTAALQAAIDAQPKPLGRASLMSSTSLGAPPVRTGPSQVPNDIVEFFVAKGATPEQAHGIAAGIVAESGGNERAVNPTSGALGLGQHLGARKAELLRRYGPNPSREQQLENIWRELQGGDAGGKAVLAEKSASAVLDAYIRKFMRPAAGAETAGDLTRGMKALGLEGEPDSAAPARADLDELGDVNLEAELAARELDDAAEKSAGIGPDRAERPARPILKRELFASDENWLGAQLRLWDDLDGETGRQAAGNGPPAREAAFQAVDLPAEGTVGVERGAGEAAGEFEPVTASMAPGFSISDYILTRAELPASGPHGFAIERTTVDEGRGAEEFATVTYRDEEGLAKAGLRIPLTDVDHEILGRSELTVYVDPALRRQGIASQLYALARSAGYPIDKLSGKGELSEDGAAMVNAMRARAASVAAAAEVRLDSPALERFGDPEGDGVKAQVESLEHDLRAAIDADPEFGTRLFAMAEDDKPRTLLTILDDLDAEDAAVAALKACL